MSVKSLLLSTAVLIGTMAPAHAKLEPVRKFAFPDHCELKSIAWSADGRYFAAAGGMSVGYAFVGAVEAIEGAAGPLKKCGTIIWSIATGEIVSEVEGTRVAWGPGHRIAGAVGKTLTISNAETGAAIQTMEHGDNVSVFAWSPDGQHIATGVFGESVTIWNAESGDRVRTLAHEKALTIKGVAWGPDGRYVAASAFPKTLVFGVDEGEIVGTVMASGDVAWSGDGKYLAIGNSATVSLWRTDAWDAARRFGGGTFVWSPDSRLLYGVNGSTLAIKNAETGTTVDELTVKGALSAIALSPDGKTLAFGDSKGTVWFVDVRADK